MVRNAMEKKVNLRNATEKKVNGKKCHGEESQW